MLIDPFGIEMWMNEFEDHCDYNLAETCIKPMSINDLLELSGTNINFYQEISTMTMTYGAIEGTDRLRTLIASLFQKKEKQNVLICHGAIGANSLVYNALISPGDSVTSIMPTYQQHYSIPESLGAEIKIVQLKAENNFLPDLNELKNSLSSKTKLISLTNPNNPTGTWVNDTALKTFMRVVPADCLVVLDEAYFEYAQRPGYPDGTTLMAEYPNLMVTRTFSKVYGLASMRIGYALSSPEVADLMNRVRQPFNVNDPCMAAAEAALHDTSHLRVSVDTNAHGMQVLEEGLHGLGYATIPSIANFITFDTGTDAGPVYDKLLHAGVIVRPIAGYGLPQHLRVSIGTEHENRRFLAALERITASA